jgi:hypothetical protein
MLQNVRHSSVVWGIGLEADGEDIVGVVACNVKILCAGLVVLEVQSSQLELWDVLDALEGKAMKLLPNFGHAGGAVHCSISAARCIAEW